MPHGFTGFLGIFNMVLHNMWLSWQLDCQIQLTDRLFCVVNYGCR